MEEKLNNIEADVIILIKLFKGIDYDHLSRVDFSVLDIKLRERLISEDQRFIDQQYENRPKSVGPRLPL
jgi:hypothetical protein